jgi:hypothetical protein
VRAAALHLAVAFWTGFYLLIAWTGGFGFDSHAYWLTRDGIRYASDPGARDAYLYSPAFAQAIRPLTALPWPLFATMWAAVGIAAYLWLTRAVPARSRLALLALCLPDIVYGNVWWIFALVLAFGLRRPALWAVPALLKITPAVGFVWFAVRREWRNLAIAGGATAGIAAVSVAAAPDAWRGWVGLLGESHDTVLVDSPLAQAFRVLAALGVAAWAARTDRPRALPAALWLAAPMLSLNGLGVFVAAYHLAPGRPLRAATLRPAEAGTPHALA